MKIDLKTIVYCTIALTSINTAIAGGDGIVTCPPEVKVGKPLYVTTTFTNEDCTNEVYIKNIAVALIGNSGTSGNNGLQGPFINDLIDTIPVASCTQPDPINAPDWFVLQTVGATSPQDILIMNKVPRTLVGSLAAVVVAIIDEQNKARHIGQCLVSVVK